MDSRLEPELDFWRREIEKYPGQDYAAVRASNIQGLVDIWPEILGLEGRGLDLGCSPVSVFENSGLDVYAVDPLLEEYQKIYTPSKPTVKYIPGHKDDGKILFANGYFDYVFCINVIDHTPHWLDLICEIKRVLAPGGLLYFMVNFDEVLMPPNHTKLWNYRIMEQEFIGFFPQQLRTQWNEEYQKYMFWGKFRR